MLVAALLAVGWLQIFGTSAKLAFQWPAIVCIAAGGVATAFFVRERRGASKACWGSLLLLAIYLVVRSLTSEVRYFGRTDATIVATAYVFYGLIVANAWRLRSSINALIGLMGAVVIASVAVAAYQKFYLLEFHVLPGYSRSSPKYPSGFFNLHTHFAGCLALVFPYFVARAIFGKASRIGKFWWVFCIAATLLGVVLSSSRSGYVGILAGGGCVIAITTWIAFGSKLRRSKFVWLATGVVTICAFAVVGVSALGNRFESAKEVKDLFGSNSRGFYWDVAFEQFADSPSPMVGDGARSFSYHYPRHLPEKMWWGSGDPKHVHNDYVQLLVEYGVLGLLFALFAVCLHWVHGVAYLRRERLERTLGSGWGRSDRKALVVGAISSLIVLAVISLFDFNLHLLANAILGAFGMGVLASFGGAKKAAVSDSIAGDINRALRVSVGLAALGLLLAATKFLPADVAFERGERYFRDGKRAEAMSFMHRTIERDPSNFGAWHTIAILRRDGWKDENLPFMRRQKLSNALDALQRAHALFPESHLILSESGSTMASVAALEEDSIRSDEFFEEAFRQIEEAVQLAPKNRHPHIDLGDWWETRSIRYEVDGNLEMALHSARQARLCFRKASDLTPSAKRRGSYQFESLSSVDLRIDELEAGIGKGEG